VIRAEGDADLDIVRTAVSMTSENYHTHRYGHGFVSATASYASPSDGTKLYFRSDKASHTGVYDIQVMKQVTGSEICQSLLFLHAFTGCDTTSRIFGIGKKSALQS